MWWLRWMQPSSPSYGTSTFILWPFWTMVSSGSRWMASFEYDESTGHELWLPSPCSIWPSCCSWSSYYGFPIWCCEYTSKTRSSSKSYTLDTFAELWNGHQPVGRKTWRSYQQEIWKYDRNFKSLYVYKYGEYFYTGNQYFSQGTWLSDSFWTWTFCAQCPGWHYCYGACFSVSWCWALWSTLYVDQQSQTSCSTWRKKAIKIHTNTFAAKIYTSEIQRQKLIP